MMASHHPQGERRQPGARLPYRFVASRSPGRLLRCKLARTGHLYRLDAAGSASDNARFLVLSGVRVPSLACARPCTVSPCRRLAGGGPSGASLHLYGCREDGQLLRGRGPVRENDGSGPVGEAALRGGSPARADAPRTRAAGDSRLGGVWPPFQTDGCAPGGRRWEESPGEPVCAPATRRTEGGVSVSVERTGDDGRRASPGSVDGTLQTARVAQDTTTLNYTSRPDRQPRRRRRARGRRWRSLKVDARSGCWRWTLMRASRPTSCRRPPKKRKACAGSTVWLRRKSGPADPSGAAS